MATYQQRFEIEQRAQRHFRPISFLATAIIAVFVTLFAGLFLGFALVAQSEYILNGVTVDGVAVGNMTRAQLSEKIDSDWQSRSVNLIADDITIEANPTELGIQIDKAHILRNAYLAGRNTTPWWYAPFAAIGFEEDIAPRYLVDWGIAEEYLQNSADKISIDVVQPQIVVTDGVAAAIQGSAGRQLDVAATLALWQENWFAAVEAGGLEMVTQPIDPSLLPVEKFVDDVNVVLSRPIEINGYDPIRNEIVKVPVSAEYWVEWLQFSVENDALITDANTREIAQFLEIQNASFDGRFFSTRDAENIRKAILTNNEAIDLRIFYPDIAHIVESGETIASIGKKYGIPYPYLTELNPDVEPTQLRAGTEIIVPSPDSMIPLPVLRGKRIIVSLSTQRMTAYEGDVVKWDWPISSGMPGSPTSPGVFQIQTHLDEAFANGWQLNLPFFMGIYRPVPGVDFMNGFHGFPSTTDGQVVWQDRIGKQGTYGCIMLADQHINELYEWADQGMIVEVVQ